MDLTAGGSSPSLQVADAASTTRSTPPDRVAQVKNDEPRREYTGVGAATS
jgi:hypothetical protein